MERENLLSVGLAVCLLFALGASSNALGDAVTTDPDEVIEEMDQDFQGQTDGGTDVPNDDTEDTATNN